MLMYCIGEQKTLSFTDFNLQKEFIASIEAAGYQSATPLQSLLIPLVAERKSALVLSQSVAGKTGAILIPAINYILENPNQEKRGARILILTSRRDRVSQINYTIKRLSKEHTMRFGFIVSGRPYQTQMRLMRRPLDIMIATPGRLNDLMENKKADFSKLEMLIVDDFSSIYRKNLHGLVGSILNQVSNDCPSLVFVNDDDESTAEAKSMFPQSINIIVNDEKYDELNNSSSTQQSEHAQPEQQHSSAEGSGNQSPNQVDNIDKVAKNHKNTQTRNTNKADSSPKIDLPKDLMAQDVYVTDDYTHKIALMDHFLDEFSTDSTVIYTSTSKVAKTLQDNLTNHGHSADIAHELSEDELAKGSFETLIISDQDKKPDFSKLAKGFDTHLVHFDLPFKTVNFIKRLHNHENKRDEAAILIVDSQNYNTLKQIEKIIGSTLEQATVPGLEPLLPFVNKSKPQNRNGNGNNNKNTKNNAKNKNRKKPQNTSQRKKGSNNDKSKRQRKGPFGRLNGGVHRKQDSNNNGGGSSNTGGRKRSGTNNNQNRRPKVKVGVSSRGTSAPATSDRAWQSDFAEPKERQATSKKVVIRYKDKKRSLVPEKPDDESA